MNANRPGFPEDELPTLAECATGDCFCEYECERVVRGKTRGVWMDGVILEEEE